MYSESTPDDGERNFPKHAEFHARIKFVKLMYLVGFIIKRFITMHGHMNVKFEIHFPVDSGIFLCPSASRLAARPDQPPTRWGMLSSKV